MIEIDVQIAKKLGYTYAREGDCYRLYDPRGLVVCTIDRRVGSVWQALIRLGQERGQVPQWTRDLTQLVKIATDRGIRVTFHPWADGRVTAYLLPPSHQATDSTDHDPALALARAWLLTQGVQATV